MSRFLLLYSDSGGAVAAPTAPTILTEVYGEDWNGTDASFSPTVGPTVSKVGGPGRLQFPSELGGKYAFDINSTDDGFVWDSALSTEKLNYAFFTVQREIGNTSGGNCVDFRDGTNLRLIISAYNTNVTTNGWHYGQTASLQDYTVIAGEARNQYYIRLHLFEDNAARIFLQGGSVDKTGVFEDTKLDLTLRFGSTASTSLDIEIAHIGVYSLPLGEKFTSTFLDEKGDALQTYYGGGGIPEALWSAITV